MFVREMGCEPRELIHWLPMAGGDLYPEIGLWLDGQFVHGNVSGSIRLTAKTMPRRRIALMNLPVTHISFEFPESWQDAEKTQFMSRFDLYTRRGGG